MIRVERRGYRGWPNAYFLSNDVVELVVLADVGPRIIHYSLRGGENQFHEFSAQAGLRGVASSGRTEAIDFGPGPKSRARISQTIRRWR